MTATASSTTADFLEAILARDFGRARAHLHPEISFRAMTPNRVWEAADPAGVEQVLRTWLDDPDEEIERIDATASVAVEDTLRVGWQVRGSDADGRFVFEQQAYVREHDGQIVWLRVMCSGPRPLFPGSPAR